MRDAHRRLPHQYPDGKWFFVTWHLRDFPPLAAGFKDTLDGLTTVAGKALLVRVP
jgi:hypothetical protein